MKGCRPLTPSEIESICNTLGIRDRALFILGIRTGFRISELISLNIDDILYSDGTIKDSVKVSKCNTKGKAASRIMPMHDDAKAVLLEYIRATGVMQMPHAHSVPLFISSRGKRVSRGLFHRNLKNAMKRAGIQSGIGILATHSMRKTFAAAMYKALDGNILDLQTALGHKSLSSTASYIQVNVDRINNVIRNLK